MRPTRPVLLFAMLFIGCGSDRGAGTTDTLDPDTAQPLPQGPCPDEPLVQEARATLAVGFAAAREAAGQEQVQARPAQTRYRFATTSLFDYEQVQARQEVARLHPDRASMLADPGQASLENIEDAITIDWETESLLVLLAWPDHFLYEYGQAGERLTVYAGHLLPCEAFPEEDLLLRYDGEPLLLAVPKASEVQVVIDEARFRFVEVAASDRCERDPDRALITRSGGSPSVLIEPDGAGGERYHMWYEGFSAATGVVIDTVSADGIAWTPPGWDEAHMGLFEDHSAYSDHYRPSVVAAPGGGYWVFYFDLGFQFDDDRRLIARSWSEDGVHWSEEVAALEPGEAGAWDGYRVWGPSVVTVPGGWRLYYSGADAPHGPTAIGLATSDDGLTWTRHPDNPVFTVSAPGRFDDASVSTPSVTRADEGFVMVYSAVTGQTYSLGLASSEDGLSWARDERPVLAADRDWERMGLSRGSALQEEGALTLWYTGVNKSYEPAIGRARCARP
jgi:hypothetical protein